MPAAALGRPSAGSNATRARAVSASPPRVRRRRLAGRVVAAGCRAATRRPAARPGPCRQLGPELPLVGASRPARRHGVAHASPGAAAAWRADRPTSTTRASGCSRAAASSRSGAPGARPTATTPAPTTTPVASHEGPTLGTVPAARSRSAVRAVAAGAVRSRGPRRCAAAGGRRRRRPARPAPSPPGWRTPGRRAGTPSRRSACTDSVDSSTAPTRSISEAAWSTTRWASATNGTVWRSRSSATHPPAVPRVAARRTATSRPTTARSRRRGHQDGDLTGGHDPAA